MILIKNFQRSRSAEQSNVVPHRASARFPFSTYSYTSICCLSLIQQPRSLTRFRCRIPVIKTTSFKKSSAFPDVNIFFAAISVPSINVPCKMFETEIYCIHRPSSGAHQAVPPSQMLKSFNGQLRYLYLPCKRFRSHLRRVCCSNGSLWWPT